MYRKTSHEHVVTKNVAGRYHEGMRAVVLVYILLGACAPPRRPMTPRQIVDESKPAIVRIEAGRDRVGTGFVVDTDGVIATNLHVVAGTGAIRVIFLDGSSLVVDQIAGVDGGRDLVLLRVRSQRPLRSVRLGNSDRASAGDPVVAIGNPLGVLDYTVSDGLISSVRTVGPELKVLQTSAPISQGSSGGPLFNAYGEVVGVTTAIMAAGQNLNFAIPSNYLRPLMSGPSRLTPAEFQLRTQTAAATTETPKVVRRVPVHELGLLDGCTREQVMEAGREITAAISSGAPLFDQGNQEACFRIFDGMAVRLAASPYCAGIQAAASEGLRRAEQRDSFADKAWALRDMFDGLLDVLARRARMSTGAKQ